jgi:hypothetical protein
MQRRLRRHRGFGLVELIVVLGLLFPSVGALAVAVAALPRPAQVLPAAPASATSTPDGAFRSASSISKAPAPTNALAPSYARGEAQTAAVMAARTAMPSLKNSAEAIRQDAAASQSNPAAPSDAQVARQQTATPNAQYLAVATATGGSQSSPPPAPTSAQGLVLGAATSSTDPVTHAELNTALAQFRLLITKLTPTVIVLYT